MSCPSIRSSSTRPRACHLSTSARARLAALRTTAPRATGPRAAALALLLGLGALTSPAQAQDHGGGRAPAAAAAPLIPWQRTLDDALALSQQTGKPLLICVNADGEVASDSIARGRYRDPAFAAKMEGFIPVVASPVLHTTRTHDGRGVRVPCPRFGRVTCAEHQAIEPLVYERWFDGRRVTPRHVGVSFDTAGEGEVLFDLFLLPSLSVIDQTLEAQGVAGRPLPDAVRLGDAALMSSRDAAARARLEGRFVGGPLAERRRLAEQAGTQPGLLRLALRDADASVRAAALEAVIAHATELPVGTLKEAAREAWGQARALDAVLAGLSANAAGDAEAERLAAVLGAASRGVSAVDVGAWQAALSSSRGELPRLRTSEVLYAEVGRLGEALERDPLEPGLPTTLAVTLVEMADASLNEGTPDVTWLWEQALEAARTATEREPDSGAAWAALARADWELGGTQVAADAAARAAPGLTSAPHTLLAVDALHVLVQARFEQINVALDAGEALTDGWVADVVAGTRVLLEQRHAAEWQQAAALDAVAGLGLDGLHGELARRATAAAPRSGAMHEHLRWVLLRDGDALAMLSAYDHILAAAPRSGLARWFVAYAALAAGDRLRDEGRHDDARRAYDASLAGFEAAEALERNLDMLPQCRALALAGRAGTELADGQLEPAAEFMARAARTSAAALDLPDGNGAKPRATLDVLLRALARADRQDLVRQVEDALAGRAAR